jgi:hypothetical protein
MNSPRHDPSLGWGLVALILSVFVVFFGFCVYLLKLGLELIK